MKRPRRVERRRRIRRVLVRALRRSFPHLGRFTPSLSSRLAEALFRTPPKQARLRREERALEDARFSRTPNGGGYIPTWNWGEGSPVVLVHGWGGHAGRLTEFVAPLVRRGFSVIAFDAPGHGDAGGRHSSLTDFVAAIRAIARKHGPFEAIIGHSLGAAACALAVRQGLAVSRVVLLSPPADPEKYSGRFARFYRMSVRDQLAGPEDCRRRLSGSDARLSRREGHSDPVPRWSRGRPRVAKCRTREDARSRTSPDPLRPAGDFARRGVRRERDRSPGVSGSSGIRLHSAGSAAEAVARSIRLLQIR
jgi:pimeloyl-ACP methyl ester carboxylesterase